MSATYHEIKKKKNVEIVEKSCDAICLMKQAGNGSGNNSSSSNIDGGNSNATGCLSSPSSAGLDSRDSSSRVAFGTATATAVVHPHLLGQAKPETGQCMAS